MNSEKETYEIWINVFPGGFIQTYSSEDVADSHKFFSSSGMTEERVACKHVIIEKGEGLSYHE